MFRCFIPGKSLVKWVPMPYDGRHFPVAYRCSSMAVSVLSALLNTTCLVDASMPKELYLAMILSSSSRLSPLSTLSPLNMFAKSSEKFRLKISHP